MGCCRGFVGEIFNPVVDTVKDIGRAIDDVIIQPVAHTVEAIIEDPKKLAMVALSVMAPGAGTALGSALGLSGTAATIVGQAAINTALNGGDVKSALIAAAVPVVGKELAGAAAQSFVDAGMDKALADSAGKVVSGAGLAAAQGKDPLQALISGGVSAGTAAITRDIPGFTDLPQTAQRAVNAAVAAELLGKDASQAAINSAIQTGLNTVKDQINVDVDEARGIMQSLGYRNPTEEEVQQFAGQMSEEAASASAQEYINQHSVSEDEARKYLTDLGYNPTDEEVKQFAKQGADVIQSDIESQLGQYAGEHTIDRAEAEKFFQDLGYTPSEEELQQFMRQGADITGETVSGELGQYVDANQITEDEARDIYAQLGLKNPTQEDIEKLMGQYAESELGTRAEENLDAARYNSLYEMIQDAGARAADDQTQSQLDDLGGQITDVQSSLEEQIAGQGEQFQTLLQQYEDLGMSRDEALQQAMTDMQSTLGEQITGQGEQFQTLLQQYEDLGLSRDEALQQAMTDMQGTLGEQIAANQDATQAGFAELENKFKTMYDESNTDTQAKFDELTDSQKALAASLAASTGDLQAAIDEAAQNTTDMFANLQDTFGGQLQDFQTTVDQRMQELQDQGLTYQQALDTVNGELGQMREDFGIQLGGTEEKLGKQIEQQGVSFGNLFSNWQKTYQDQAAKDAAARAAQDAANAKAAAAQNAATQAQIKQQGDQQSLMNMLMLAGLSDAQSGQQAQQPVQTPVADVKSFEELGFGDIFGTSLGFSAGGDVDDLLNILRG